METRASLWRPVLTVAISSAYWAVRQTPDQLQSRSWVTYLIMTVLLVGSALGVWGIQLVRGRRWTWFVEMVTLFGLLITSVLLFRFLAEVVARYA